MATTYYNDIQKLYVAYFNRPADTAGLAYWEGVVEGAKGSTTAVSAAFAASAEYKTAYAGMANADVVNQVYLNLFGRAAEQAGKDYWAGLMTSGKITIDQVVTQIAAGAQGSDLVAYNDKVAAASAFTTALGTTNAYSGANANAVAKLFLSGITDNASFATATDPYALGATIAKVNAAGTTFSLQSGLAALTVANTAHTNFLDAFDGKADGVVTKTDADVTGAVTTASAAVGTQIDSALHAAAVAAGGTSSPEEGLYSNANTSAAVKAALLTEAQTDLANKLTADQATLATATANIAKVPGLSDALNALTVATATQTAAQATDKAAMVDLAAKLAAYNAQNGTSLTVAADGTVTGLITTDSKGNLVLATGVTETKNPGVTALLSSDTTKMTADAALASSNTAVTTAQATVSGLDLTTAAQADLKGIAAAMTIVKLDAGALPTAAQITTEQASLHAIATSDDAIAAASGATQAQKDAAAAADAAASSFDALVTKFHTDDNADPLVAAQASATTAVKNDNTAISNLTKALATLATANTQATELAAINGQVKAASDAFTANNLLQPVTLDAGHTAVLATAGADIYVAGTTNASILNFGLLGSDALYIGSKYTLNTTGDITKGNDSVLEAFIIKSGSDTQIVLEQKAFASSEATPGADLVTITLTGVDSTHVHLTNGIITVS